jgi:hypothetical protein
MKLWTRNSFWRLFLLFPLILVFAFAIAVFAAFWLTSDK